LGLSGWIYLIALIPFINIVLLCYLSFGKGSDGLNNYGEVPAKQPRWMVWAGVSIVTLTTALAFIGFVSTLPGL
jgi:hypothetical protein